MQKLRGNYASAILLIHPNREWKMTLQKKLIDRLDPTEVGLYNFEDYGDFWISRLNCAYSYSFDESEGILTITADTKELKKSLMTFGVEVSGHDVKSVVISNMDASETYEAKLKKLTDTRYLAIPDFTSGVGLVQIDAAEGQLPFSSQTAVYDVNGRLVKTFIQGEDYVSGLPKGIYIIRDGATARKIMI
ncbi:MAG: T9SS type A sorting domain-containing protein [Muribaculaceae bacterium]|nr:T9SS type A sorting domain-containing protein [Muribaculaceae bacterium]